MLFLWLNGEPIEAGRGKITEVDEDVQFGCRSVMESRELQMDAIIYATEKAKIKIVVR